MVANEAAVQAKRRDVIFAYSTHGFHSRQYQKGFDQLHDMNLAFMAHKFRKERGLPPHAKTPYC